MERSGTLSSVARSRRSIGPALVGGSFGSAMAGGEKSRARRRRILTPPVLAVVALMGFVFYATVFVFIDGWLGLRTAPGFLNAVAFIWFAVICLWSFLVAVFTDPGRVPSAFVPETEDPQKDQGMHSKYCNKCSTYKPPRTHHCRICKRCVLKMDHHCTWISNCVGYNNYKPFIICVFHAAMASIYSTVILVINILNKDSDSGGLSSKLFYVLSGSVMFMLSFAMGSLLGWHIYLSSRNLTTIEYRESVRAMWLAKKSGQNYRHQFDVGIYNNLIQILGPNMLKWLFPMALGHLKDGTQFPVSNDSHNC